MKNFIIALITTIVLPSAAIADSVGFSQTFNVSSDYRFRGISQTENQPSVSGEVDLATKQGFYLGTDISTVSSNYYSNGIGIETDLYAGFKKKITKDLTIDIGSYNDLYPGSSSNGIKFDTNELYAGLYTGPLSIRYSRSISNYFGTTNSRGTSYITIDFLQSVGKLTLIAHAAHTSVNHYSKYDYDDYNLGLSYEFHKGWTIAGKYFINDHLSTEMKKCNMLNGHNLYRNSSVVTLIKTF